MSIDKQLSTKIDQAITLLKEIAVDHAPAAFANSFGAEDMVLTDLLCKHVHQIQIFSLDTGRLPPETYNLMDQVLEHYNTRFDVYFPDPRDLEPFLTQEGANCFYRSVSLRKECCRLRKVLPLQRALHGKKAWITGLRREQAPTRTELPVSEWDAGNGLQKFNPLTAWTHDDVWNYIRHFSVPYNALHDQFYPSIGCAPCTRAIAVGEDIRAGRWWWEDPANKECGLHVKKPAA
ncbi:MAG: phosphoadenylyl-sulfate reductase [Gammaproteobacteria bacterium]|nr:phosphoadenylyl-sulfate reductase [Gammaproteobacteria bacterium]